MNKKEGTKGSLMLLMAAFFWGTTFVAQSAAAKCIGAFTFNATRSFVGAIFLGTLIALRHFVSNRPVGNSKNIEYEENGSCTIEVIEKKDNTKERNSKRHGIWFCGILCGLVLFAAMNLQQSGITLYPEGVASSGRSGFITATYVIMVALCSKWMGKKVHPIVGGAVVVCIVGMYFLCMAEGFSGFYLGDVLEFGCAVCFAGHIMVVDRFSYCDSLQLSCIQFLTSGSLSLIVMLVAEQPSVAQIVSAWIPIFYAGIFSSGVAYTLQMVGQKYAAPAVASIVMSLESVFAAVGGFLVLHEYLTGRELLGCILVFSAVMLAQIPDMKS